MFAEVEVGAANLQRRCLTISSENYICTEFMINRQNRQFPVNVKDESSTNTYRWQQMAPFYQSHCSYYTICSLNFVHDTVNRQFRTPGAQIM